MRKEIDKAKMITSIETAVLEILKESLFDSPAKIEAPVDWSAVFQELKSQSLLPVAYIWMKRHKNLDEKLKKEWTQIYASQTYRWYAMMKEQSDVVELLSSHGYAVAVMKGNSIAGYYPNPQLRGSSDIDLLVRWEEYDRIFEFLLEHGYSILGEKQEHKHHFAVCRKQFVIEVHKRPGGTRLNGTVGQTELLDFFQEGLNHIEWIECCGYKIPVLPPVYTSMILLLHIAQHIPEGIGLRHILDWMMFAEHCVDDEFWNHKLKDVAEKGQVVALSKICTKMCQKYLGLSDSITWCKDASEEACTALLEYLFFQGDFGSKAGEKDAETKLWTESNDLKSFFYRLNISSLYSMPKAQKHRLLRPIAWIYQIIRYLKKGINRRNPLTTFLNSRREASKRKRLFQELGIKQ